MDKPVPPNISNWSLTYFHGQSSILSCLKNWIWDEHLAQAYSRYLLMDLGIHEVTSPTEALWITAASSWNPKGHLELATKLPEYSGSMGILGVGWTSGRVVANSWMTQSDMSLVPLEFTSNLEKHHVYSHTRRKNKTLQIRAWEMAVSTWGEKR